MLDATIETARILNKDETPLWTGRVSDEARAVQKKKDHRRSLVFLTACLLLAGYFMYSPIISLLKGHLPTPNQSFGVLVAIGAVWLGMFSLKRSTEDKQRQEKASIYILTPQRLLAADKDYRLVEEILVDDMDFIVRVRASSRELHIARKSDPESENMFFADLLPNKMALEAMIDKLIVERDAGEAPNR